MSEIIEAVLSVIRIVADNPASIFIVLGFIAILLAVFVPIETVIRIFLGLLGVFMIGIGIYVHKEWLARAD